MDARMYCRTILPIALLYCGTLVCSNVVYLYLNISFIQMLKVRDCLPASNGDMLMILGGRSRCHTHHELVLEGRQTLNRGIHQHPHHNPERRNGCVGRDQVFLVRVRFPVRQFSLRRKSTRHGPDSSVGQWPEDGPAGQSVLLCAGVCCHDLAGGLADRIRFVRVEFSCAGWVDSPVNECRDGLHA